MFSRVRGWFVKLLFGSGESLGLPCESPKECGPIGEDGSVRGPVSVDDVARFMDEEDGCRFDRFPIGPHFVGEVDLRKAVGSLLHQRGIGEHLPNPVNRDEDVGKTGCVVRRGVPAKSNLEIGPVVVDYGVN